MGVEENQHSAGNSCLTAPSFPLLPYILRSVTCLTPAVVKIGLGGAFGTQVERKVPLPVPEGVELGDL